MASKLWRAGTFVANQADQVGLSPLGGIEVSAMAAASASSCALSSSGLARRHSQRRGPHYFFAASTSPAYSGYSFSTQAGHSPCVNCASECSRM
jgi:hypothetical protein